jgi:uncharacterized protein YndB with AHSA1/START domain
MAENDKAVFRITIRGSIEAVWRELTKTDTPQQAVFNSHMHVAGAVERDRAVQWRTPSGRFVTAMGKVVDWDPPRRYAHTFRFARYDDAECMVAYDLRALEQGVEVTMTISGMQPGTRTAKDMTGGGSFILNALKAVVETGRPGFGARMLYRVFGWLEFMFPAKARVENWPLT